MAATDPIALPSRVYAPGSKNAVADANLILEVVRATAAWQTERDVPAVVKPIRELIWFVWEQPRLVELSRKHGAPLIRSKYPSWVPWSASARRALKADPKARLVIEHVYPSSRLVRGLLSKPPANQATLIRKLSTLLNYAIITPEDNKVVTNAGYGNKLVKGSKDPWDRYRASGIRPEGFKPLHPLHVK